jgi:hypothetical protein
MRKINRSFSTLETLAILSLSLFFLSTIHPTLLSADTFELSNGTIIEGVITSESSTSYEVRIQIGKVTIEKKALVTHSPASPEANAALIKKWRDSKRAQIKGFNERNPFTQIKDGKRFVKYQGAWISFEEFEKTKKSFQEAQTEFIEKQTEENRVLTLEEEKESNKEQSIKLIQEGKAARSETTNSFVSQGDWFSIITDNFILYYNDWEDALFAATVSISAENALTKIKMDLSLKEPFSFNERIEIILIKDEEKWRNVLKDDPRIGNDSSRSSLFFKEILLFSINDASLLSTLLAHESARITLNEFMIQSFSKKYILPLWLSEGFAGFEGEISHLKASPETLLDAILKNYLIKLDSLVIHTEYPGKELQNKLFFSEAVSIISFIHSRYGSDNLNSFILKTIEHSNRTLRKQTDYTVQNGKHLLKGVIEDSFLNRDYSGFKTFEENWLKNLMEECKLKITLTRQ